MSAHSPRNAIIRTIHKAIFAGNSSERMPTVSSLKALHINQPLTGRNEFLSKTNVDANDALFDEENLLAF